ncbi:MAG: hypothetical protein WBV82_11965, partial [Myxococcaceae bacterium]
MRWPYHAPLPIRLAERQRAELAALKQSLGPLLANRGLHLDVHTARHVTRKRERIVEVAVPERLHVNGSPDDGTALRIQRCQEDPNSTSTESQTGSPVDESEPRA